MAPWRWPITDRRRRHEPVGLQPGRNRCGQKAGTAHDRVAGVGVEQPQAAAVNGVAETLAQQRGRDLLRHRHVIEQVSTDEWVVPAPMEGVPVGAAGRSECQSIRAEHGLLRRGVVRAVVVRIDPACCPPTGAQTDRRGIAVERKRPAADRTRSCPQAVRAGLCMTGGSGRGSGGAQASPRASAAECSRLMPATSGSAWRCASRHSASSRR